jgi:sialic acid synthase SpsE
MNLPYIIAEIGLAHEGNLPKAMELVWQAKEAGANAVKFQAVWADRLVSKTAPTYFHQEGVPAETQHAFFARSDGLTREDYEYLAAFAKKCGVDFLCTAFDPETVHWLAPLVPAFKVASADITNLPLLEAIAGYEKPVYLSTGAATKDEVAKAAAVLMVGNVERVILLHCVLAYPTPMASAMLNTIRWLQQDWGYGFVGYSDHTLFNLDVLVTAWLLGASVIEKHFTLDKTQSGNDHYHSADPADLRALVAKLKELQAMIGDGEKRVLPIEEAARLNARQSWHAARDLPAGHQIAEGDVVLKRPGTGLPASENPIGLRLGAAVEADAPILDATVRQLTLVAT